MMPVTRPPCCQHRAGDLAHQAEAAAAVDEADAVLGHALPELARGLGVGRIGAGVGAAVDADVVDAAGVGEGGGGGLSRLVRHALLQVLFFALATVSHTLPCSLCWCHAPAGERVNRALDGSGRPAAKLRRGGAGGLCAGRSERRRGRRVCGGGASWLSLAQRSLSAVLGCGCKYRKIRALSGRIGVALGFRQAEAVPMQARAGIVSLALGIVGGAVALAHAQDAERAGAADAVRLRAEELAQAASRRFDEVMGEKQTRVAQAQGQAGRPRAKRRRRGSAGAIRALARAFQPRIPDADAQALARAARRRAAAPARPRRRPSRAETPAVASRPPAVGADRGPGDAHRASGSSTSCGGSPRPPPRRPRASRTRKRRRKSASAKQPEKKGEGKASEAAGPPAKPEARARRRWRRSGGWPRCVGRRHSARPR